MPQRALSRTRTQPENPPEGHEEKEDETVVEDDANPSQSDLERRMDELSTKVDNSNLLILGMQEALANQQKQMELLVASLTGIKVKQEPDQGGEGTTNDDDSGNESTEGDGWIPKKLGTRFDGHDMNGQNQKLNDALSLKFKTYKAHEWYQYMFHTCTCSTSKATLDKAAMPLHEASSLDNIMRKKSISFVKWFQQLTRQLMNDGYPTLNSLFNTETGLLVKEVNINMEEGTAIMFQRAIFNILAGEWEEIYVRRIPYASRSDCTMEMLCEVLDKRIYHTANVMIDSSFWNSLTRRDDFDDNVESGFRLIHVLWNLEGRRQRETNFWEHAIRALGDKKKGDGQTDVSFYGNLTRDAAALHENGADANAVAAAVRRALKTTANDDDSISEANSLYISRKWKEYESKLKKEGKTARPWDSAFTTETKDELQEVRRASTQKKSPQAHNKLGGGGKRLPGQPRDKCSHCKEKGHWIKNCEKLKQYVCPNCNQQGHNETFKGCPKYPGKNGNPGTAKNGGAEHGKPPLSTTRDEMLSAFTEALSRLGISSAPRSQPSGNKGE